MSTEEFQDFSYATQWEKLAGEIEGVLRRWLWTQEGGLTPELRTVELKQKLHFRKDAYSMFLHLPGSQDNFLTSPVEVLGTQTESLPSYSSSSDDGEDFEFLPQMDSAEVKADKSRARSNPVFSKEVFVPPAKQFDEDSSNLQRWLGITRFVLLRAGSHSGRILDAQEGSTLLSAAAVALSEFGRPLPIFIPLQNSFRDAYQGVSVIDGRSVFFDVDSSHLIQPADHLRSVSGQLQSFAAQLQKYSAEGSRLCADLACGVNSEVDGYTVDVSTCIAYRLPLPLNESGEEEGTVWNESWDEGCVWQPWASQKDPIESLELDLIWDSVELTPEDPAPVLSAMNATEWRIHALTEERQAYESWSIFSNKNFFNRKHLKFPSVGDKGEDGNVSEFDGDNFRSLSARLTALYQAMAVAEMAKSVGDLGSEAWWEDAGARAPTVPPPEVFQDSLSDMFGDAEGKLSQWNMTQHVEYADVENRILGKVVPLDSLTSRLGLHSVVYRNARAVSLLWTHFVQKVRLQYWEKLKQIPLMPLESREDEVEPEAPDLNMCLIHQKLQLLNVCIHRLRKRRRTPSLVPQRIDSSEYESCNEDELDADVKPRGVARVLEGAYLEENPDIPINIPLTQLMPIHTSDSLIEEASMLSAMHDNPEDRERAAREQAKVLLSDMAAFKAANPAAQLSDFVKWHSPKDWIKSVNGEGYLSARMSHESNNRWVKHWKEVEAIPAAEQIPLFDPALAGERALYFLETIPPEKLFSQLLQAGMVASYGCLERAKSSKFPPVQEEGNKFFEELRSLIHQLEEHPEVAFRLLDVFRDFERTVVTGESLLRHLPRAESTVSLLTDCILSESPKGVTTPAEDRKSILKLLMPEPNSGDDDEDKKVLNGVVLQHEWVLACRKIGFEGDHGQLCHRLYFKDTGNEVRLGSTLVSEL